LRTARNRAAKAAYFAAKNAGNAGKTRANAAAEANVIWVTVLRAAPGHLPFNADRDFEPEVSGA
jgi:phage/plasmid primase-like uncharacterized protein